MTKTNATTATTGTVTAGSGDAKICSVDRILNEMSRSFALCKSTKLFQFYDNDASGAPNSLMAAVSPTTAAAAATPSNSSSWLPSLEFWNSDRLTTRPITGATTTTTTTSSGNGNYSQDLYEKISGSLQLSNQLITENRIISAMEECFTNFMTNTVKITTTGVFVGAVAGAAVATGVIVGMMAATGAIATTTWDYSHYVPRFLQMMTRRRRGSSPPKPNKDKPKAKNDQNTATTTIVSAGGPWILLQGHPSSSSLESSPEEQCQSCLQTIESTLSLRQPHGMRLRRLTVYLVTGRCTAATFRKVWNQYSATTPSSVILVSIVYVQQLEDEQAVLQIEAMACRE